MIDTIQFAQKAFVVNNNKLLIIRKSLDAPIAAGFWEVPGGRLEKNESLQNNLAREVFEETNVIIEPIEPFHLWDWYLPSNMPQEKTRVVAAAVYCKADRGNISMMNQIPSDNIDEIRWIDIADIDPAFFIPNMLNTLKIFLDKYS